MKYLYLDNFRGFSDAYIPISDVTFLVGENSTGKTSILSVCRFLASHRMWLQGEFSSDDLGLGHFKDLVSVHASDTSYFRVGLIERHERLDRGPEGIHAFLFTFSEKAGVPEVAKFTHASEGEEYTVRFSTRRIAYRVREAQTTSSVEEFLASTFKRWTEEHRREFSGLRKLAERKGVPDARSLIDIFFRVAAASKSSTRKQQRGFAIPTFGNGQVVWLAPIRTKPHRTYDEFRLDFSPEGGHTPYLIRKLLKSKAEAAKFKAFIQRVGTQSGLFESVTVKNYGRSATSPFELDIVLSQKALSVSNVGYGVSQSLPVFVELFAQPRNSFYAIQQPEVHLHPRAQASIGDVIHELAVAEGKTFMIETHSDYMLERFRLCLRSSTKKANASILFFERHAKGNRMHHLPISSDGDLPGNQPRAYRDFFIREQLKVLGLDDVHRS